MTKVKICGVTNGRDARAAVEAGADFLGLNFYRGSLRYVTVAAARKISKIVARRVTLVGVFVNEEPERVVEIAREVGLDFAQLHGDESVEVVARVRRDVPVIRALRVKGALPAAEVRGVGRVSAILLDGFSKGARGGTGKTFDWKVARRASGGGRRIFLAGGITPENAAEAIRVARPYAIDVCSGVESAATPRKKDAKKIAALMSAVRGSSAVVAAKKRKRSKGQ
jgi:phosphoribosylanthranilate isomerase